MQIVIIYASFGEGHKKAAFALEEYLNCPCKDILDFIPPLGKKILSRGYIVITEYFPILWKVFFLLAEKRLFLLLLKRVNKIFFRAFLNYLKDTTPSVVITTHFFVIPLVSSLKKKLDIRLISIITDLRVHPLWVDKEVNYYFAALDETKKDLLSWGISPQKIIVGYVPLRKGFLYPLSLDNLKSKFSLPREESLLFVSSLRGRFPFLKKLLSYLNDKFNIFIIYGDNHRIKDYIDHLSYEAIRGFYFYENIWELISLSFIIITKPGGLTIFEGLFKRKFFIFTHYIPGQEKANMDILIKYGVGRFVSSFSDFKKALEDFRTRQGKIKYPLEVKDIREVLGKILQQYHS